MTRKFTFLLMAFLALAGFKSWGQETLTVCDGTVPSYQIPINGYWFDTQGTLSQFVIPSSKIAELENKSITQLQFHIFYMESYGTIENAVVECSLAEVESEVMTGGVTSGLTKVFEGNLSTASSSVPTTMSVPFDTPYNYGGGNLLVSIKVITSSGATNYGFYGESVNYNASYCHDYQDNFYWFLPKTTITYEQGVSCSAPTDLAASDITATGATISWTGNDAESYDLAYGVASTFDLSNPATYTLEDGLIATSVQLTGLTAETEYKCAVKAHCSAEDESAWSAVYSFTPTAKTTLTVNDGTNTNQFVPIYGFYADATCKSQFIIPSSVLEDMVGGTVSDMTFYLESSSNISFTGTWNVYVKEVDYTTLSGLVSWSELGSSVYHGNMTITNGLLTVNFITPITYNGNNLLIGFNETVSGNYPSTSWLGVNQSSNTAWYSTYSNNGYAQQFLPKTTFTYLPAPTYTVTVIPSEHGVITADPKTDVPAGTTVSLSATPNTGYVFLGEWHVTNTTTSEEITVIDNQFTMPASDVTVSATFDERTPHFVYIDGDIQHGTVELAEDDPEGYYVGETIFLTVTPDEGYFYPNEDEITVTDDSGNPIDVTITEGHEYSFTMPNSDVNVTAVFNMYFMVNFDEEMLGGSIGATSDGEHFYTPSLFIAGTDVYFVPNPDEDYEYVEQSISVFEWDGEEIGNPISVDYNSGYAHITMPATDIFVTATFNRIKYNVTDQIVNPAESGYFYIENTEHIPEGTAVVISDIEPAWDYQFASVSVTRNDNQATVETWKYGNDYVFNMPDSDVTVTVNFEAIPYYDVTITEPENGSAYINGAQSYHAGDEVVLMAIPYDGYIISATDITITPNEGEPFHPTDNGNNEYTFNMPASNVTITATFREPVSYTINYYVNGKFEGTEQCKENEAIDIYTYYPSIDGVTCEGWCVAPIDTYVTEKPAVIGEEYPTHDYDLYAVFSYTESVPAASKDGETWKKVTSTSELNAGDEIVLVYGNYVVGELWGTDYHRYEVSIANNEISNLPEKANVLTLASSGSNWKLQYYESEISSTTTLSYNTGGFLAYYGLWSMYGGYDSYDEWAAIESSGVMFCNTYSSMYIGNGDGADYITAVSNQSLACQAYKKDNPVITTNYYMTEVLTSGEVTDLTTNNIIVVNPITVSGRLEMNEGGLFRNENTANFVFADGAQFYYTGEESVNATFEKEITGYSSTEDNYYLIANPTDEDEVAHLTDNSFDIFTFNPGATLEWKNQHDNAVIEQGTGYLYANSEDVTLQFAGELMPAGETALTLVKAADGTGLDYPGFNLVGNPFACDAYIDGSFYRMNGTEFVSVANGPISPCEGIFVEALEDGEELAITTAAASKGANLELAISQGRSAVIDRAIVRFDESNDMHKFMMNPAHTNIRLAKNGQEYAAISSETEGEIPVSFMAEKDGSYTISVNTENVEANYLHLIDNMTGMDTDLLSTPSYTFNASTSDYAYRFKLVFNVEIGEANGNNGDSDNFAFMSNGNLVINGIEGEATMQIVDVLGRVVSTEIVSGSYNKALNLRAGLYIINLNGMTQKIVVE